MLLNAGELSMSLCLPAVNRAGQATAGTGCVHIAVATRQKSTARRLVSSMSAILVLPLVLTPEARKAVTPGAGSAVLEGTYPMLFSRGPAVTLRAAGQHPIVA
jgi:hypothetical protein